VTAAVEALGALGLGRSSSRWQTDIRFIYFLSSRRAILQNAMHFVDVRIVKARIAGGLMREGRRTSLTDRRLELFGKRKRQRRGSTW
jgi:hypothetical protein